MGEHVPSREKPWVRVRDQFGHELDRHYLSPLITDGTFEVIEGYPPNETHVARPTKYRTEKDGTPAVEVKGDELNARIEQAGLAEAVKGKSAHEKRTILAEYEDTHEPDPSQEG